MFILLIIDRLECIYAKQNACGDQGFGIFVIIVFSIFIIVQILRALVFWIKDRKSEQKARMLKETDDRLIKILYEEFPNYNYDEIKSDIFSVTSKLSRLYICPRCGGILDRDVNSDKPMKCTGKDCSYPK